MRKIFLSILREDLASDERQTNCSSLLNIERLFVYASSMAIDKSYATSLSENTAMIGHSHQRIQDGQLHISPDMSNRNESTDKKSFDLERTHNGKSCVLRKRILDSKYGGFDVNVCDRAVKHKRMFCDIRRNVKESNGRFDELWMLPKWLGKKVRWKIWTKFTKKNDQERRDWKRKNFILKLERRRSGEMKQRRTIFSYGKTVVRYKIEKKNPALYNMNGEHIALWKHILNELHLRNQSYICRGNSYLKCTIDNGKFLEI